PLMAGVFYNRLKNNTPIPLGSCATIVYIITDIQGKDHPEFILYSDLEIESPYNTYINSGLPPGPISNPGEVALNAAFYPVQSEYLYFLLKNAESGQHIFTKNLSDHNKAYNLYIKNN
ncbi:MAG: endolytic transglycosylase MltG, partial [Bacteroidetes bacterium]